MKIGYWYLLIDDGIHPVELGRALEERGFESLFLGEHTNLPVHSNVPFPSPDQARIHPRVAEPLVTLGVLAGATERLTLGTSVLLAAQHEPIVTAKAVATLDTLSGGRIVLGVGPGWHDDELRSHGVDPRKKVAALREHVMAMREIWTKEEAEFHGVHVDFAPLYSWPKPVSGPPVLVAGGRDPAWRKIAEYGDGWLPIYPGEPEPLVSDVAELRRRAAAAGRTGLPVTVMNAPADEAALAVLADGGIDRVLLELPRAGRDVRDQVSKGGDSGQRAHPDGGASLSGQREPVEQVVDRAAVAAVNLGVVPHGAHGGIGQPGPGNELIGESCGRRVALHGSHVPEQADWVMVVDPIVLRADQPGHHCRRCRAQRKGRVDAGGGHVLEQPLVMIEFFCDMHGEVFAQRRGAVVGRGHRPAAPQCCFEQWHGGADDLVHRAQVPGIPGAQSGGAPDGRTEATHRGPGQLDDVPQLGAAAERRLSTLDSKGAGQYGRSVDTHDRAPRSGTPTRSA